MCFVFCHESSGTPGNVCDEKQNYFTKYSIYSDMVTEYIFKKNSKISDSVEYISIADNKLEFTVFPNPNNGSFYIYSDFAFKKENISIFDVFGNKVVFSFNIENDRLKVKINEDIDGIVFIRIKTNFESKIFKIIIQ